jgi:hypothetical protein
MIARDQWNIALSDRLSIIRDRLMDDGVIIAGLPNEANQFGQICFNSLDWAFQRYTAKIPDSIDKVQEMTWTLLVRLFFEKRRTDLEPNDPEFEAVLEWMEIQVLQLVAGFKLPETSKPIYLVEGMTYVPEKGAWQAMITFAFTCNLVPQDDVDVIPVEKIGAKSQRSQRILFEVNS